MRIIQLLLLCVGFAVTASSSALAAQAGQVSVRAILFVASNEKSPPDPKLAPYEAILRSNLRFESYRYVAEGSATIAAGGKATITLPQGNRVDAESDASGAITVHRGGASVSVARGGPGVVLVGGSSGKGVYGIIVFAR
jgi:hypothetical protein